MLLQSLVFASHIHLKTQCLRIMPQRVSFILSSSSDVLWDCSDLLLNLLKMSIERVETSSMYSGIMLVLFLKKCDIIDGSSLDWSKVRSGEHSRWVGGGYWGKNRPQFCLNITAGEGRGGGGSLALPCTNEILHSSTFSTGLIIEQYGVQKEFQ